MENKNYTITIDDACNTAYAVSNCNKNLKIVFDFGKKRIYKMFGCNDKCEHIQLPESITFSECVKIIDNFFNECK